MPLTSSILRILCIIKRSKTGTWLSGIRIPSVGILSWPISNQPNSIQHASSTGFVTFSSAFTTCFFCAPKSPENKECTKCGESKSHQKKTIAHILPPFHFYTTPMPNPFCFGIKPFFLLCQLWRHVLIYNWLMTHCCKKTRDETHSSKGYRLG